MAPKRKRDSDGSGGDSGDDGSGVISLTPGLPPCQYGLGCYRKNPQHFLEYSHPKGHAGAEAAAAAKGMGGGAAAAAKPAAAAAAVAAAGGGAAAAMLYDPFGVGVGAAPAAAPASAASASGVPNTHPDLAAAAKAKTSAIFGPGASLPVPVLSGAQQAAIQIYEQSVAARAVAVAAKSPLNVPDLKTLEGSVVEWKSRVNTVAQLTADWPLPGFNHGSGSEVDSAEEEDELEEFDDDSLQYNSDKDELLKLFPTPVAKGGKAAGKKPPKKQAKKGKKKGSDDDEDASDDEIDEKTGETKKERLERLRKRREWKKEKVRTKLEAENAKPSTEPTGVYLADHVVPPAVRDSIDAQLQLIAEHPNKDFHPGSHDQVQNLIHPSLFPYVLGITPLRTDDPTAPETKRNITELTAIHNRLDADTITAAVSAAKAAGVLTPTLEPLLTGRNAVKGKTVDKKKPEPRHNYNTGKDETESDRELDYEDYEALKAAEDSKRPARAGRNKKAGADEMAAKDTYLGRPYEDSRYQWMAADYTVAANGSVTIDSDIPNLSRTDFPLLYRDFAAAFQCAVPMLEKCMKRKLRGTTVQVITKAANYVLAPGGKDGYEGSWHVEGMSHERIVASAICYYHTDPWLKGAGLSFRRLINSDEYDEAEGVNEQRALSLATTVELGTVPTPPGRMLVFPNHMQHKVAAIENTGDKVGVRKILCFFVCDPDVPVVSSRHCYDQNWDKVKGAVQQALGTASGLPGDVLQIALSYAQSGMTMAQALAVRLELMAERKYFVDKHNKRWARHFTLCEH